MNQPITYLLHRFPRVTDTFIMREIRGLQKAGTDVKVISVWKPSAHETMPELLEEWSGDVSFLLPNSILALAYGLISALFFAPKRFFAAFVLALRTANPGIRGHIYSVFYLSEAALASRIVRQSRSNHLHNHFGDQSGTVTMLASVLLGIDFSISFHGPHVFLDTAGSNIKEKARRASFNRCISYFCRSQLFLAAQNNDLSSTRIIHCGLELRKYPFRSPREEVLSVFCAARLAPEKGIEFLLEAMGLVLEKNRRVMLRIAGDGSSRASLEATAAALGISRNVVFLGQLSEARVTEELIASDLFVLPSLAEGLPVSAMEAMAIGVPVVATNIAGLGELIENGKSGLLVRPTDPDALAKAMFSLMADRDFRMNAAELGRKKIEQEFDIEVETAKLHELFQAASRDPVPVPAVL
jgi:colanic acid/amylovoran biosynthesis glycosyltransferase